MDSNGRLLSVHQAKEGRLGPDDQNGREAIGTPTQARHDLNHSQPGNVVHHGGRAKDANEAIRAQHRERRAQAGGARRTAATTGI